MIIGIENLKEKIEYFRKINLEFLVTHATKCLIQSIELTYARYEYLTKENGIIITESNYKRLFMGAMEFEKRFGIDKKTLINKYPYNKRYVDDSSVEIVQKEEQQKLVIKRKKDKGNQQ